ncbi:PREDICTED: bolA-like protein DDB_G0274169 isoform X3 [Vollenhovia emeryi]|uniref:bolA-like protein DDB_G0274169 isoform X3 n=1 Tax=Vollenhovia emeryi TaxID=411798 RepID=UPI0005F394EE|nr:PREDICTED: bolA-like protein DDB_G0274169 isoform X3 [Vollenhovia emeryi]
MYRANPIIRLILGKKNNNAGCSTLHRRDMSSCETLSRPVETSIRGKLEAALNPLHCDVINESYMHNVPKNSESHFKVVVVSEKFDKQPLIKAKTPEQWEASNTVAASPVCRGGFGK